MIASRHINKICCIVITLVVALTAVLMYLQGSGFITSSGAMPYESKLFDTGQVHTVNIVADEEKWQEMLETATSETYISCNVVIDGEAFKNVAIRPKGNSSLSQVAATDSDRYSFKIEFDHYDDTTTYFGLDKLCLNNIVQDNTYLKDYLCYDMLRNAGAEAPLCSFTWITVNNEDWGLYVAAEGIEEGFAERVYGSTYGNIYKPDSMDMNKGWENGNFPQMDNMEMPENFEIPEGMEMPENMQLPDNGDSTDNAGTIDNGDLTDETESSDATKTTENNRDRNAGRVGEFGGMGSSNDVKLLYSDDNYDSYSNIFDNAVFDVTDSDKDRLISSLKQLNEQENISEVVNVEEVINYFVAHNFVLNGDSYTGTMIHNYYLRESDGQLSMIAWDYNLAFGGMSGSSNDATTLINSPIDTPTSSDMSSLPMISWIFSDETYTQMYHEAFSNFLSSYFDSGYFEEMIDSVITMISPYVEKDPSAFCTYEEFVTASATLKEFCLLRAESIRGQLSGEIASTGEGQDKDKDNFIDASSINVNDMGSNNFGMGRRLNLSTVDREGSEEVSDRQVTGNENPPAGEMPDIENFPAEEMPDVENFEAERLRPGDGFRQDSLDSSENAAGQSGSYTMADSTWVYLSASSLMILIGILIVKLYKR